MVYEKLVENWSLREFVDCMVSNLSTPWLENLSLMLESWQPYLADYWVVRNLASGWGWGADKMNSVGEGEQEILTMEVSGRHLSGV